VAPDAFQGQVEPIADPFRAATRLADRPPAVDAVSGKDHYSAHRVPDSVEGVQLRLRYRVLDVRYPLERRHHGIAGEPEFAQAGPVMEIRARSSVVQLKHLTAGQALAPQQLVIAAQGLAMCVGILVLRRVPPKVKRDVDV
jgi:hypothetical protein